MYFTAAYLNHLLFKVLTMSNNIFYDEQNLFNLCGQSENYVSKIKGDNMEGANLIVEEPNTAQQFEMLHDCHLERIMVGDFSQCGGPDTSDTSLASKLRLLHNFSAVSLIAVGCHLYFV